MRIDWDLNADALYVRFSEKAVERQLDHFPVIVDVDALGAVVGVEIMLPVQPLVVYTAMKNFGLEKSELESVARVVNHANILALGKHQGPNADLERRLPQARRRFRKIVSSTRRDCIIHGSDRPQNSFSSLTRFDRTPESLALQELSSFRLFSELKQIANLICEHDAYVVRSCKEEFLSFVDVVESSVCKRVMQIRFQSGRVF